MGEREFNLDEISPACICRDLFRNLWVIVLAAAAAWLGVTGAAELAYVPEYTASATLAVSMRGTDGNAYTSLSMTAQMAEVFSEVFQSRVLLDKAAEDMGKTKVEGEISSSVISETNLITVQAVSVNPREAYLLLRSALENYESVSDYLFSNAVLRTVKEPAVPYAPSNFFNVRRWSRLGTLAGAAAAAVLMAGVSALRMTVKNKVGARRNLDGRILGMIPFERKKKTLRSVLKWKNRGLLMNSPTVSMEFAESCRKAATRLEYYMRKHKQKIVLITSFAENEGKSSVAANLALALAEKGRRVLLIDADLRKPAQHLLFERTDDKEAVLGEYLRGKIHAGDMISFDEKNKIYFIFQKKPAGNAGKLLESERIEKLLAMCREHLDYVILDSTPLAVSSDAERLMRHADTVAYVVRQDWSDIRAINDQVDLARQCKKDFAGFILNAFYREISIGGESRYYGKYHSYSALRSEQIGKQKD